MKNISLKSIYEGKTQLTEGISEPSPQQWKPVLDHFKQSTGIVVPVNNITLRARRNGGNVLVFDVDLQKEIRGAVMQTLLSTLELEIKVYDLQKGVGSFGYTFTILTTYPGDNNIKRYEIGTLGFDINGKMTGKQGRL